MVSKMPYVFYDTEILAIVHRVKSKASGLASTSVWCWLGKQSCFRDREEKKLHELSKRYGTSAVRFSVRCTPLFLLIFETEIGPSPCRAD